jgi:hypothetical protein
VTGLPLQRTRFAGVVRALSSSYRSGSRQRKQAVATLHAYAARVLDRYAGVGSRQRPREHAPGVPAALVTFALRYFDRELRLRDVDRPLREPICAVACRAQSG